MTKATSKSKAIKHGQTGPTITEFDRIALGLCITLILVAGLLIQTNLWDPTLLKAAALQTLSAVGLGLLVFGAYSGHVRFRFVPLLTITSLYVSVLLYSIWASPFTKTLAQEVPKLAAGLVTAFICAAALTRQEHRRLTAIAGISASLIISIVGFTQIQGLFGLDISLGGKQRLSSLSGNATYAAAWFAFWLAPAVALFITTRAAKSRLLTSVSVCVIVLALFFTGSRGGWAGAALSLILLGLTVSRYRFSARPLVTAMILLSLLLGGVYTVAFPVGNSRINTDTYSPDAPEQEKMTLFHHKASDAMRIQLHNAARAAGKDRLITGWGAGAFGLVSGKYLGPAYYSLKEGRTRRAEHAHNEVFQQFAETGAAGLLIYLALTGFILTTLLKPYQIDDVDDIWFTAFGCGFAGLMIAGLTGVAMRYPAGYFTFWFSLGAALAACKAVYAETGKPVKPEVKAFAAAAVLIFAAIYGDYYWRTHVRPSALALHALRLEQKNDRKGALNYWAEATQLKPTEPAYLWGLAKTKSALGDHVNAVVDFGRLLNLSPDFQYAYRGRGLSYFRLGRFDEAVSDFRKQAQKDDRPESLMMLATALGASGNESEALKAVSQAIKRDHAIASEIFGEFSEDDADSIALALLAKYLTDNRLYSKAIPFWQQAATQIPSNHQIWNSYGKTLMATGRYAEAEPALAKAVESAPRKAEYLFDLALVKQALGQTNQAYDLMRQAEARATDETLKAKARELLNAVSKH